MRNYPKNRKSRLSTPEDLQWFPQTFLAESPNGTRRRYISGLCEICGEQHRMLWANFSRGAGLRYRFRHLKCSQTVWNAGQFEASKNVAPLDIAARVARKYQHGCARRGVEWGLSVVEVAHLTQSCCAYCNAEPSSKVGKFTYNGIDRKNNDVGYLAGNCVTCCRRCNFLKGALPFDQWVAFLDAVRNNWKGM